METRKIDAGLFCRMIIAGAKSLDAKKEWINELNVFPVPDGDTGTNMCMTIFSAVAEMEKIPDPKMDGLAKAISSGSLRGARGNSGVILSQLIRGFAKVIGNYRELDKIVIADSFQRACETAYKAVMKPKEGTILTVARAGADRASELAHDDSVSTEQFFEAIIEAMEIMLARTPDMLPVLKQAGVIDAGGQGLIEIFKGASDALSGKEIDYEITDIPVSSVPDLPRNEASAEEIRFGYCTEFIINLDHDSLSEEEEDDYRTYLNSLGDSIVLVAEDDIVKTHVHTNDPGLVLQRALSLGSLTSIKIDNMREQHVEKLFKDAARLAAEQAEAAAKKTDAAGDYEAVYDQPDKDVGFIAVSVGEGMKEVFFGLGVDYLIEGGQTMNPSTEDILMAINQVNAPTIFLFPNNKNIILAANQAASMVNDKQVIVVPTKTIPQGITALINFVPESDAERNRDMMTEMIDMVRTGQVTYAIRDSVFDGRQIREGDYMGIGDSAILSAGEDLGEVVMDMLREMVDEESSFICIYYGEDIERDAAEALAECLGQEYPDCEVEVQHGGQPIYYYIVSVE